MAFGVRAIFASLTLALAATSAHATSATVTAAIQPEGYARIVFSFDRAPETKARLANSVLVVSFGEAVDLTSTELARGLGSLVGVIRKDPDESAIRMSLNRSVKLVTTEAGEKLFVDLLPTNWAGLPPPLPAEVIADLTRAAREAREIRAEEARLRANPTATLSVEGATHPTFRRLIFSLGNDARVDWRRDGPKVLVTIAAPFRFDPAAARARLPVEFAGLDAARKDGGLVVSVPAPGAGAVRGFREDGDFILDIDRADSPAAAHLHAAPAASAAHPATPAPKSDHAEPDHAELQAAAAPATAPQAAPAPGSAAAPATDHTDASAHAGAAAPQPEHDADEHAAAPAPATPARASATAETVGDTPSMARAGDSLRLTFPFERPTAAAVFQRGRTLWAIFDDAAPIDAAALVASSGGAILSGERIAIERGQVLRFTLPEPRLVSASPDRNNWVVALGETSLERAGAIELARTFDKAGRAAVKADLPGLGAVRTVSDPEIGDKIVVATLGAPARGKQRPQQFVEFAALPTAQGLAFSLLADDVKVTAGMEQLTVSRDDGLSLSSVQTADAKTSGSAEGPLVIDAATWDEEAAKPFNERENELSLAAALSRVDDRPLARLALARFYIARDRPADAKAVLGAIIEDGGLSERDERLAMLRAAAEVQLGHPQTALGILAAPTIRMKPEAALWRAAAEAQLNRPGPARTALEAGGPALGALPRPLRAKFTGLAVELALGAGDGAAAATAFEALEVLPAVEGIAARELTRARIAEALGQNDRAAATYATIARGTDPAAAAEAEQRAIELGLRTGKLSNEQAIDRLERLVTGWRGDQIEARSLARLIDLYGDAGRWRDAFTTLRVAVEAFPDADGTRALQDKMQERFTDLFLGAGADAMPKLDALALFYDFKEMSPGGRRGDELVRRLADKLVDVELLDQASDLLSYQIGNRLKGAARAQVAARAALVDLMNGKPAKALETLRKTRQADLPASLMRTRLRLEARALAETGRVDLALEIAAGLEGPEALRLKADILWSSRRWTEAGEALEAALGSAWRGAKPLEPSQRADVMRAAIASSLAGDGLAVDRIRQKYAGKMAQSPQSAGFEVVTAPVETHGDAFREVARSVAATSSFDAFLDEYRKGSKSAEQAVEAAGAKPDKA